MGFPWACRAPEEGRDRRLLLAIPPLRAVHPARAFSMVAPALRIVLPDEVKGGYPSLEIFRNHGKACFFAGASEGGINRRHLFWGEGRQMGIPLFYFSFN